MSISSKLFSVGSNREYWSAVSLNIAKRLEDVRKIWFDSCVKILQESAEKDSLNIDLVHIHLGGKADSAIKAYQLYLVSCFLSQHTYISPSGSKDFGDILYAQVCGTQMEEVLSFFSRYHEVRNSLTQLFHFCSDVAKYITDSKAPIPEGTIIVSTIPSFIAFNHIVVASCFGDEKTVKKLESELNKDQPRKSGGI
jgi:hypothetical protein